LGIRNNASKLTFEKDYLHKRMPWDLSRPRFMEYMKKTLDEMEAAQPGFFSRLRIVAVEALKSQADESLKHALTALAFVGQDQDTESVEVLLSHPNQATVAFAKTCLFEIKKRSRRDHSYK